LRLSQTTVARRIARLERAVGVRLFDRKQSGYSANEIAAELLSVAEQVEVDTRAFRDTLEAVGRRMRGVIRVTTNEGLANVVMAPAIKTFRARFPDVRVDLLVDERRLDLASGAADVALRTGPPSTGGGLVVRRLPDVAFSVYCSHDYVGLHGMPATPADLDRHALIGVDGPLAALPAFAWLRQVAPQAEIATRSSSITNLISAVRAGLGVTALPCFLADRDPTLVRCLAPIENAHSSLWLVSREELRDVPRVRAFLDHLAGQVVSVRRLLAGEIGDEQKA